MISNSHSNQIGIGVIMWDSTRAICASLQKPMFFGDYSTSASLQGLIQAAKFYFELGKLAFQFEGVSSTVVKAILTKSYP